MIAPSVTVLVPARDEERWITGCLEEIAAQDYPHHLLEVVVVVDAASTDATDRRAKEFLADHDFARAEVVRNASATTPANLNAGLALARGEIVCRVDARSRIPSHYVRTCAAVLATRPEVAVVGGSQVAVPADATSRSVGIARALNNRWGTGLARYRRGATSGPADTVYLGAFRTADLRSVGGWRRDLPTNQDFDLNRRLAARGAVWFDASLEVGYIPRPDLAGLWRQYRRFGAAKARYWRLSGDRPRPRQVVLLVGVPAVAGLVARAAVTGTTRRRAALGLGLLVGAAAVESSGTRGPRGGLAARGWSAAALATVGAGWLTGVWGAGLTGREGHPGRRTVGAAPGRVPRAVHLAPGHGAFDTRVFHKEALTLTEAGFDVAIVAPHDRAERVEGVEIVPLPAASGRADRFLRGPVRLLRAALRARGDVYHLHDVEALPAGVALALLGRRVIWDSHEDYPRLARDRPWVPAPVRRPLSAAVRRGEWLATRAVDVVVSAEEAGAERFPPGKTVVIRNLPLAREFADPGPRLAERSNALVYIGDVTRQRGAREMVELVGRLPAQLDARLILVGRFGERGLEDELRSLPGWDRCEARGVQDRRGVIRALHEGKVGLVLWHPTRKHAEGAVPVKLFEYMAAGLPVVASDFPALRALVAPIRAGELVDPFDVEGNAEVVGCLLAEPRRLEAMGERARRHILGQHTWERERDRLLDVYERVTRR